MKFRRQNCDGGIPRAASVWYLCSIACVYASLTALASPALPDAKENVNSSDNINGLENVNRRESVNGREAANGQEDAISTEKASGSAQSKKGNRKIGWLDNGKIRLGVNLEIGGAITYLAKHGGRNLINSFDWGRQIQMSHYSGPIPFAPNGNEPRKDWAGLGWNPIQSGDCYGNAARVVDYRNNGRRLYIKCVPMQWPLNNEPGECTFECWMSLDGVKVNVRSRINNARVDHTQYQGRDQELPAVYTNAPWYRLMTYSGDKPFTGEALTRVPSAFPWSGWQCTENWAALVDDSGDGLGIWHPGDFQFIGGFAGKPGTGGPADAPTGYIAPVHEEIIDHNIQFEYRYMLIVGNVDTIRNTVYEKSGKRTAPSYQFRSDRQHWWYYDATDTGWPIRGELDVALSGLNPQLIGPNGLWSAETSPKLEIVAAFHGADRPGRAYWKRFDQPEFSAEKSYSVRFIPDGKFHKIVVDLSKSPEYRGSITGLRIDPVPSGLPGETIEVRSIRLLPAQPTAK